MTKFKAIRLQQYQKLDTLSAFQSLNVNPDMRSYEAAAAVLRSALENSRSIRLLTNNPSKMDGLKGFGLNVVDAEPLVCGTESETIRAYLEDKRRVLGHKIP
jgi:GTP cyclohydrolase II